MNKASYISAAHTYTWLTDFAGFSKRVLGDVELLSAVVEWQSNLPGGRLLDCVAWVKSVTLNNGNVRLSVNEIDGANAGLYVVDFQELHSIEGSLDGNSLCLSVNLLRPDGEKSDQKYQFDLPSCKSFPESELRFPL